VCNNEKAINKCKVCGEPIGLIVNTAYGAAVYPRACKCKRCKLKKQQIEDESKQKQIRLNQIIVNSMMSENFKACSLKNWDHHVGNESLFKIAKEYISKFQDMKANNHGMLIYGNTGNGKTYFSACIAGALLEKLVPVICVGAIALTERISISKRNFGNEGIFTVLNALENADLLILDDLGTEEDNKWTRAMIYQIIEKRNSSKLPIIITTNMTISDLKDRYDERTYSRLTDMCSFIRNTGNDIRKVHGKIKTDIFLKKVMNP
jgi:DNA replication protein DnaC